MPRYPVPVKVGIALVICLTFVIGHTIMTVLHVAPINPMSVSLDPAISTYMLPLFQQNWQLFAPEPISAEHGLLVRARVRNHDGHEGSETVTEFHDLTSPMVHAIHANRLFPPRRTRLITNTQHLLSFRDPLAQRLREALTADQNLIDAELNDAQLEVFPLTPGEEATHELAIEMMRRVATEAAKSQWGEDVTHIQVRLMTNRFPPFSERENGERIGDLSIIDSEWMPVVD